MTCVIGLEHGGRCYVGCDSRTSNGAVAEESPRPKVVRRRGWLFGLAGSWALLPVLRALDVPPPTGDHGEGDAVVAAIRAQWRGPSDGVAAIAAGAGRVWVVQGCDWSALRSREYAAIGEGEPFALGALRVTRGQPPRERVRAALEAARFHCPSVGGRLRVFEM